MKLFKNHTEAGHALSEKLKRYSNQKDVLVLTLQKPDLLLAYTIANDLNATVDLFLIMNIKAPQKEDLSIGAIASGGREVLNNNVIKTLEGNKKQLEKTIQDVKKQLIMREQELRGDRPTPRLKDRQVIIVDNGTTSSAQIRAAVKAIRRSKPRDVIFVSPVIDDQTKKEIEREVDEVITIAVTQSKTTIQTSLHQVQHVSDQTAAKLLEN